MLPLTEAQFHVLWDKIMPSLASRIEVVPADIQGKQWSLSNGVSVSYLDLFNWMHTNGFFLLMARGTHRQRSVDDIFQLVREAFAKTSWCCALNLEEEKQAVMDLFVASILPHILFQLWIVLAGTIGTRVQGAHVEQPWRLGGHATHHEWSNQMSSLKKVALEIQKVQGHWWMLYCPPTDGRLRAMGTHRHSKRLEVLEPQVCC
jgi:hypothetical protein